MRSSNFTEEKKRQILNERDELRLTVKEICKKYRISSPTFYSWKRELGTIINDESSPDETAAKRPNLESDIKILKRLYINLSAHNYELAKFLEK